MEGEVIWKDWVDALVHEMDEASRREDEGTGEKKKDGWIIFTKVKGGYRRSEETKELA